MIRDSIHSDRSTPSQSQKSQEQQYIVTMVTDEAAVSPRKGRRSRASISVLLAFITFVGSSAVFSSLMLQETRKISEKVGAHLVVPSHVRGAENTALKDMAQGKEERLDRYKQAYQHRPPESSQVGPDSSCGSSPLFEEYFAQKGSKQRSANGEDAKIYKLFSKIFQTIGNNGSYVEMGAYDGVQESNSRFFDICLGWSGLLIEANPTMYQKLLSNRPHAHRMSFAPSCNATQEANNHTLQFHDYPLTNAGLSGSALTYKDRHVVDVPCGSLTPVLLDIFEGGHVDFFSLDVEGSEPSVVENIDFDKVFIELLMVEHSNTHCGSKCESRDRVRTRMQQASYTRYSNVIMKSDLYIHPRSKYQLVAGEYETLRVQTHIAAGSARK